MNRVRMGLTGLAFVFLVVMVAAAGLRPFDKTVPPKAQEETLATLGVTPGADEQKKQPPLMAPAPERPPSVLNTPPLTPRVPPPQPLIIENGEKLTQI